MSLQLDQQNELVVWDVKEGANGPPFASPGTR